MAAQQRDAQPMPSMLGLHRDIAQIVIDDAGLSELTVKIIEKPAAGPAAMVVNQKPTAGTDLVKDIEQTVSTPTPVPALAVANLPDGRSKLEQLGAVVEMVAQFNPSVPKNLTLDTSPKAGEMMPTVVSLIVSGPGDALTLASVASIDGDSCGTANSATINDARVGDSPSCDSGFDVAFAEYSLSRQAAAFEAVVGTDDRGVTGVARVWWCSAMVKDLQGRRLASRVFDCLTTQRIWESVLQLASNMWPSQLMSGEGLQLGTLATASQFRELGSNHGSKKSNRRLRDPGNITGIVTSCVGRPRSAHP